MTQLRAAALSRHLFQQFSRLALRLLPRLHLAFAVRKTLYQEDFEMRNATLKLYAKSQVIWNTLKDEQGQDLVEYAAVIVLVVLALTGGMSTLANGINNAMTSVGSKINA